MKNNKNNKNIILYQLLTFYGYFNISLFTNYWAMKISLIWHTFKLHPLILYDIIYLGTF